MSYRICGIDRHVFSTICMTYASFFSYIAQGFCVLNSACVSSALSVSFIVSIARVTRRPHILYSAIESHLPYHLCILTTTIA